MSFSAFRVAGQPEPASLQKALAESRVNFGAPKEFAVVTAPTGEQYVLTGKGAAQLSGDVNVKVGDSRKFASVIGAVAGNVTTTARATFVHWYDIVLTNAAPLTLLAGFAGVAQGKIATGLLVMCAGVAAGALHRMHLTSREEATRDARLYLKGHGVDLETYPEGKERVFLGLSSGNAAP